MRASPSPTSPSPTCSCCSTGTSPCGKAAPTSGTKGCLLSVWAAPGVPFEMHDWSPATGVARPEQDGPAPGGARGSPHTLTCAGGSVMGGNPTLYLLLLLVCGLVRCLGWFLYLRFCRYLVDKTGDPAALTQAATVARAFRGPR